MQFTLPFFKKSDTKATNKFLALDINSNDVQALLFYTEDGRNYKIIGSGRKLLEQGSVRAGVIIEKEEVEEAVDECVKIATQDVADSEVKDVILGIGGSLSIGLMTTVRSKRPSKEPVVKKELDEMFDKINEGAFIQAQNTYLEVTGDADTELEMVTSSNVYLRADGVNVKSLEGVGASVVEAAVFNSFTPSFHLKSLEKVVKKAKLNILAAASQMYSLNQYIRAGKPGISDYIIIDVASDETTVAVVFADGIVATKSLNLGTTHFAENLAERMGVTTVEAQKLVTGHILGTLSQSESAVITTCIKDTTDIWIAGTKLLFEEFSGVKTFPSKAFLTGSGSDIAELVEAARNEHWEKDIPFKESPAFEKITMSPIRGITDSTGNVKGAGWNTTASLCFIFKEMFYDQN